MRRAVSRILWALTLVLMPALAGAQMHIFSVPVERVSPMWPTTSEIFPGPDYDRWWHELAECEGLRLPASYASVRFYQVNAWRFRLATKSASAPWAVGMAFPYSGQIFLSLAHISEEVVVKHEMLHLLLFANGVADVDHPADRFERCGVTTEYNGPTGAP